ncbi:hypothetical protein NKI31_11865 [Mesorhizobium sp. M0659]|uniref:hypothetical protein n=1 Tax=Mesorhizobium sp. M0659 TaxID=2956980 RepID=UPI00333B9C22
MSPAALPIATGAAIEALRGALDAAGFIDGSALEAERYLHDWTDDYRATALAILRPRSVEEVQALVRISPLVRMLQRLPFTEM